MGQAEGFHTRVVAAVELSVHHHTHTESGAEGIAQQAVEAFAAAGLGQAAVDLGQGAAEGFAVGKQVAVVVDIYGQTEFMLQEGAQSHAVAKRREVGQIASDDSVGIVGRAGECETYGHRFFVERVDYLPEAIYHCVEAEIQVVGVGWHCQWLGYELTAAHCAKHQIGASGIESDYYSVIVLKHYIELI